jgi:2-keto-3-deoxy-6-phosphogluconate aldolase
LTLNVPDVNRIKKGAQFIVSADTNATATLAVSSNISIATATPGASSMSFVVKGLKAGTTTITFTADGVTKTIVVIVSA